MLAIPLYDDTPALRVPVVTYGLVGACCAVFLWQLALPAQFAHAVPFEYGMVPAVLLGNAELPPQFAKLPAWATLFTSMFLHGGWLHLIGNMIYLWIFGKGVENALGPVRFLLFYLASGAAAGLTQAGINPMAEVPMIGASGAIAGTLGAYLILYPRANVVVFLWIIIFLRFIAVPAVILLGLWFFLQLLSAVSTAGGEPGVAFWAHVGGFITGIVLVFFLRRRKVRVWQPPRSSSFSMSRRPGTGSVPSAGRRRPPAPWG